jgi:heptosyltransferase-2
MRPGPASDRVLVVAPAWVGDAIMMQPLLMRLAERRPHRPIDVLAPAWVLPLLARMPEVDRSIPSPFRHGDLKVPARRALGRELARRGYGEAFVLPNSMTSALVPFFAGIGVRTGYRGEMRYGLLNDVRRLDPVALPLMVERFAALADRPGAALRRPVPTPHLRADTASRDALLDRLRLSPDRPVAILCPGAEYGPAKRWPAAHFATLAIRLAARGLQSWILGSPKDAAIGAEIAIASGSAAVDLCGRTGLADAIDLLSIAAVVVTNDSGLMHVACALDRPTVALYGSSSTGFTPPLSARATPLTLGLSCSPCFRRECPLGHLDCLVKLTPDRVSTEAFAAIDRHSGSR